MSSFASLGDPSSIDLDVATQSAVSAYNDLVREATDADTRLAAAAHLRNEFDSISHEVVKWTKAAEYETDRMTLLEDLPKETKEMAKHQVDRIKVRKKPFIHFLSLFFSETG